MKSERKPTGKGRTKKPVRSSPRKSEDEKLADVDEDAANEKPVPYELKSLQRRNPYFSWFEKPDEYVPTVPTWVRKLFRNKLNNKEPQDRNVGNLILVLSHLAHLSQPKKESSEPRYHDKWEKDDGGICWLTHSPDELVKWTGLDQDNIADAIKRLTELRFFERRKQAGPKAKHWRLLWEVIERDIGYREGHDMTKGFIKGVAEVIGVGRSSS